MYKSCHILKHGLCFFNNLLVSCCFSPIDQIKGQHPPIIYNNYKGEIFSKKELFERINKYTTIFENGGCPKECEKCYHIEEKDWDDEQYIDYITISHFSNCNADCVYCSNNCSREERTNQTYEILPILRSFREQGIIKNNCELHIGGGEFTIYKECDELIKLFSEDNSARIYIPTNAIKYSNNIFSSMDKGCCVIIVSLDCGSKKLYKRIKRIDAFDTVISNLEKYAATEQSRKSIRLKYIIIPTINDNINEFKKFLKIAKQLGICNLIIDIDARYSRNVEFNINPYFFELADKMNQIALKQNFITEFYSFLLQNKNNKKLIKTNFFKRIYERILFRYFNKEIKKLYEI